MKLKSILLSQLYLFVLATPVLAQANRGNVDDPPKFDVLFSMIDKIIDFIFPFAAFIAVTFIIMGGYMWMSSSGDPAKIKQAQGTLTWAIIGLIFSLITPMILTLVLDLVSKGSH